MSQHCGGQTLVRGSMQQLIIVLLVTVCILWCSAHWQFVIVILIQNLVTITMIDLGISHYSYRLKFGRFRF